MFPNNRLNFDSGITHADIENIAANKDVKVIQTDSVADKLIFKLLNDLLFSRRPEIQLRLYGYHGAVCDLAVTEFLGNVTDFSADCIINSRNLNSIASMSKLKKLSIGIYDALSFDFLEGVNQNLEKLAVMSTYSKKPKIDVISRFYNLRTVYIEGQQNGIDSVKTLSNLVDLTLRSVSTPNLNYLNGLKKLQSVDIKLGGIKSFDALKSLEQLKNLELWQIREFRDATFLSDLAGLQNLFLQSLPHIKCFPDLTKLIALRRVVLENMKSLKDFDGLSNAPNLEEFCFIQADRQDITDLLPVVNMKTIKKVSIGFGSLKRNADFLELSKEMNLQEYAYSEFIYE